MQKMAEIFEHFKPKIWNPGIEKKNPPKWKKPRFKPNLGKPGPFTMPNDAKHFQPSGIHTFKSLKTMLQSPLAIGTSILLFNI